MDFKQRHPYLFWQLIGWGIIVSDFIFLVVTAMLEFGEWSYFIIVFMFIGGLMAVGASPFIVHALRKKAVPQNTHDYTERLIRGKIEAIQFERKIGHPMAAAFLIFFSMIFFFMLAYVLGERVHLALGFASMVLALASPFILWGTYSAAMTRRFFTIKNGEKRIEYVQPADLKELGRRNPPTLVVSGEPDAVLLNFFYNWLQMYLQSERLTLYRIPASELCRDFVPASGLRYEHILLCIPEERFELIKEKAALFRRECDIMGAFPFSFYVVDVNGALNTDDTPAQ